MLSGETWEGAMSKYLKYVFEARKLEAPWRYKSPLVAVWRNPDRAKALVEYGFDPRKDIQVDVDLYSDRIVCWQKLRDSRILHRRFRFPLKVENWAETKKAHLRALLMREYG